MCVVAGGGGGGGTVNAWSMASVTTEMLARVNLSFELSRKIKWTPSETQVGLSKNVDIVQVFICKPRLVVLSISYIILYSSHCEKLQCHLAKRKEVHICKHKYFLGFQFDLLGAQPYCWLTLYQ